MLHRSAPGVFEPHAAANAETTNATFLITKIVKRNVALVGFGWGCGSV
jgi:hypothetical protein